MTTYDVFLSHASDKPEVEALARRLREDGLEPFLDKWHLIPGQPWQEAIEDALEASRTCAVFVGRGQGPWQNREMRAALNRHSRDAAFRVIPVLLPGAPDPEALSSLLQQFTVVDFHGGLDDDDAYDRLLCGIRGVPPDAGSVPSPDEGPNRSRAGDAGDGHEIGTQPSTPAKKSRLERLLIGLGLVVALVTIVGGVLDLPAKWQAWRANVGSPASTGKQELRGEVIDDGTEEPLVGALVEITDHGLKTRTDDMGTFFLEVPRRRMRRSGSGSRWRDSR